MDIGHIAVFAAAAIVYALLPVNWRGWALLIGSVVTIYWLQPTLDIRWLDYSLPTATLALSVICWLVVRQPVSDKPFITPFSRDDWAALTVIIAIALILTLTREIELPFAITSRPPPTYHVILTMSFMAIVILVLRRIPRQNILLWVMLAVVVALLIITKMEALTIALSGVLRRQSGQDVALAAVTDIQWLGFSYVAFRLIHTLRDHQNGLLPALTLREYLTYVIFFPAYTAGPLDRVERFVEDYRTLPQLAALDANRIGQGARRILIGLFKKFVIADSLAFFSLSAVLADQANSSLALWGMSYAFAFRLYFDFSGYSDIAIGLGILFGINLPENFALPYLKNNITVFWQSWHMTLSNWVRFYVYSPLSRSLLRRKTKLPINVIILICTLATMLVIGLWHGISLTFLIWGLWHGVGLFIHKLWSDRTRQWQRRLKDSPRQQFIWQVAGILLTFHFVTLGWVWFALPDVSTALRVFGRLLGANG